LKLLTRIQGNEKEENDTGMVNTFVTHWPLQETFKRLDNARLGKQRVEAYQILNLITDVHRIAEWVKQGYCWPVHLSREIQDNLRKGSLDYQPEDVCCAVTTKGWV
jgi:hypothetical protein